MKLKVWLPTEVLLEEDVIRIKAEAENGWFGLLPRHVDFVTALVPGVMTFSPWASRKNTWRSITEFW